MAKIKKRKSLETLGDVEYVMNVPMDRFIDTDAWREEIRLTHLAAVKKAHELGSRHFEVFKAGIFALANGHHDLELALGQETAVTEDEYFDLEYLGSVPERLWPVLAAKVTEALASAPKNGPRPRHIAWLNWTTEAVESMDEAEGDSYTSLIDEPRSNSITLQELMEMGQVPSLDEILRDS